MLFSSYYAVGLAVFTTGVIAKETPVNETLSQSLYRNGNKHMEIMSQNEVR
jgi:hypothetical protein